MRSKAINVMMGLFVVGMLCLTGCGGGGGGGTETPQDTTPTPPVTTQDPTPTPTVANVDLTTFKGLFTGTAAPGSEVSFTLTGSDTSGIAYDGSFTMVSDGATTFEDQSMTKGRVIYTVNKTSTGVTATNTLTEYFLSSNGNLYKQVSSSGVTGVPNSQTPFPDSAKVGDSGHLWDVTNSDGTSDSCTWKLEADTDNNTKLILTFANKNASNEPTGLEEDTFYLNSSGTPYKYAVTIPLNGQTLTMSGNRN